MTPAFEPKHLCRDALDTALHLGCGAAREGEKHHPARVDARDDEMRDPMCQRVGLAGTRAGNDQERGCLVERVAAMLDGAALLHIQSGQVLRHRARMLRLQCLDCLLHFASCPESRGYSTNHERGSKSIEIGFALGPLCNLYSVTKGQAANRVHSSTA